MSIWYGWLHDSLMVICLLMWLGLYFGLAYLIIVHVILAPPYNCKEACNCKEDDKDG